MEKGESQTTATWHFAAEDEVPTWLLMGEDRAKGRFVFKVAVEIRLEDDGAYHVHPLGPYEYIIYGDSHTPGERIHFDLIGGGKGVVFHTRPDWMDDPKYKVSWP